MSIIYDIQVLYVYCVNLNWYLKFTKQYWLHISSVVLQQPFKLCESVTVMATV